MLSHRFQRLLIPCVHAALRLALSGGAQAIVTHNLRDLQGVGLHLGSLHSLTNPQVSLPSDVPLPSWLIFDVQGMRFEA